MRKCVAARGENLQSDLGVKGLSPSQTMDFTYMFVTGPVTLSCHFEEKLIQTADGNRNLQKVILPIMLLLMYVLFLFRWDTMFNLSQSSCFVIY